MENRENELIGNPEGFEIEQKITPESELLDAETEKLISQVAEELLKEEDGRLNIKEGMSEGAISLQLHREEENKRKKADIIRGFVREFRRKYDGKNPTSVQLRTMAKSISG